VHDLTPLQLGRPVTCSDGPAGSLSDVVVDPRERRVSHLVVEDPHGAARLVPAELLVPGWQPGLGVVLSCSCADVSNRPTIRSFSYVGGLETFPENDEQTDIGVEDLEAVPGFVAADFGEFGAELWPSYAVTYDRIPPGSAELRRGSLAVSGSDEEIGTLDGLLLEGTRPTHVVLQRTRPPGAVAVPLESVTAVATDRITVTPGADAFEPVDPRWLPLS
jgi:sporulation protein YlmC with PRC-barrel domain